MKKRLISLLLVVCLLLSCLPVGALAATPEELYAQMLDLGLVDEDGTLIENNRFTVENGTTLSSLEELRLWLHELDEGDFDCKVTVDATGKVATAEQLMQVLNIEYQIAEVAEQLNLLASGAVSTQAASVNTAAHNWNLLVGADIGSESIMILSVKPYASGTYAAPQDLQVEVGLFADFLTSSSGLGDITNRDTSFGYCGDIPTNQFGTFTIQSGESGLYFSINMEKLRAYAASNIDLWDGNTYLLFQARVKSGMNTVSKSVVISLAPESSTSNIISYINKKGILSAYKNGVTVALAPESDASEGKPYSYKLTTGTASYNGKSYITFEIPQLYDRKRGLQWQDAYYKAIQAGVGDSEPKAVINSVYLLTEYNEAGAAKAPNIYGVTKSSDNGSITKFQNMGSADMRTDRGKTAGNELSTIAGFNKADAGQWNTSDAGTIDGLNKKIYDGDKEVIAFFDLYLPLDTSVGNTLTYPTTWYLESDWNTQNKSVEQILVFCGLSSINQSGKDVYELEANLYLADTTAPTVKSVEVAASAGTTFHPGDVVPIVVTFSEPVYGDYQLVYQHGGERKTLSNCTSAKENAFYNRTGSVCSNTRTFYYTVQDTDNGALSILGVMGDSKTAKDVLGNAFQQTEPLSGSYYQKFTASLNCLGGMRPQDSVGTMTATVAAVEEGQIANPNNYTVTISLSDDTAFKQAWSSLDQASTPFAGVEASIVVDGDTTNRVPLTYKNNTLTCDLTLSRVNTATDRVLELWLSTIGDSGGIYYGTYATVTQQPTVDATDGAYTISVDGWPSGETGVVYGDNRTMPVFSYVDNGTSFTYKSDNLVYWFVKKGADIIDLSAAAGSGDDLTLQNASKASFTTKGSGEVELVLMATNGGDETAHTQASNVISFTVVDNGAPFLNAGTVYARQGTDQIVTFSTNLTKHQMAQDGDLTATLYALDEEGEVEETTAVSLGTLDWSAASVTVPGEYLNTISKNDAPTYALRLTATVQVDDTTTKTLSADAMLVVRSQPAVITLTGLDTPYFMGGETVAIGWSTANFDTTNDCQFDLRITRGSDVIYSTTNVSDASGSYSLALSEPTGLREYYILTVKAKNDKDPTWSTASSTITVYKNGALDLLVGGERTESVTLKNTVAEQDTTTAPTITNYSGEIFTGLTTAEAIARLRTELSLMDTISINYGEYDWNMDTDRIVWTTATGQGEAISDDFQRAVTINYRQGNNYAPLEQYSYTSYIPEIVMMLCGLQDGTNQVTATHQYLDALTDTVNVDVERLQNKLYLFQFTPAVRTEVAYVDNLGNSHTVYSNDDGSLALLEPNGIASEINTASISGGESYRGTFSRYALKSGEGNGIYGELYPLNSLELRKAAVAQFQLLKPDGSPLANETVTLRGGVYRNRFAAENRDDAYCAGAKFAKAVGEAATLDGKEDQTFQTDAEGMLTVHMDLQQLTSANDPDAVGTGDSLEFIFELRFTDDKFQPELVIVDGSLTYRDAMRTGDDMVTLVESEAIKPFVAMQTISYTGRKIDVRNYTGVVGPSSTYPQAQLETTIMLWGVENATTEDDGYCMALKSQQTGVSVPEQQVQVPADASFPFSSIPLVSDDVLLESSSFVNFDGTKKTSIEAALYDGDGKLVGTISLPFGLVDLTAIEKVEDSPSLTALMTNLAIYGSVGGANTDYGIVNAVSDVFLKDGLSLLEDLGAETGLVKAVLTPTEDPTRYMAYLWTGLNTTKLGDLDYDQNGISLEPSYIGQDTDSLLGQVNDTFTLSDFQAMADGSYFDDRESLYGAVSQGVIQLPIMLVLEGWVSTEIRYSFDKGQWEVLTTGGGFAAGAQVEFEKAINGTAYGIPLTASFKVRGGVVVNFEAAIRYAEQLGLEWNDETAARVNDYLTSLRVNAYFEFFAGVGIDKGFTAKLGTFGSLELNNENRFLTRTYLKNPNEQDVRGQFLQLDGEVGIRAALGAGPLVTEWTIVSIGFSNATWSFNQWNSIQDYWDEASSGLGSTGWMDDDNAGTAGQSLMLLNDETALLVSEPVTKLQSRDYLDEGQRTWQGGELGVSTTALDDKIVKAVETNSYPYSTPQISDDGNLLLYLSDNASEQVEDVEVFYSCSDGGSFGTGTAIPDPEGFAGYGDSALDFDGTSDCAAAIWLREANTLDLKAGVEITEDQQLALLSGLEVVASIWNGDQWISTRLTENTAQEFEPVIAINANGQAIAAWRSVQTTDSAFAFTENSILFKLYNGTSWSEETYTLYNGSAGSVTGMSAELLANGTAAIAFSVETESGSEIYYTLLDVTSATPEDDARTIRATTNTWRDEQPSLTTVGDNFILGWVSEQSETGANQLDLNLRVLDTQGVPSTNFPESLGQLISTASFDGQFAFVKGAEQLDELSVLWNDAGAGAQDNDVIRAVKFGLYDESYGVSAPIEVAKLPAETSLDALDACLMGGSVLAVLQATTSDAENGTLESFTYTDDEGEHTISVTLPKQTSALYGAVASYSDSVAISGVHVDFTTLTTNSVIPVTFDITNQGMNILNDVTVTIGSKVQSFHALNLLPNQTATLSTVLTTGSTIENLEYTVHAEFSGSSTAEVKDTIYLDYPDVGISRLTLTKEQDGERVLLAALYNQSAAALSRSDRRVVLGVYSDPSCEMPVDGKYFADGIANQAYERILTGDTLAAIDKAGSAQQMVFCMEAYVEDAGLTEIPDDGITLYVKASIEQLVDEQWIVLPEADTMNNQKHITLESLLVQASGQPVTKSVEIDNGETTTAVVTVRNNSLQSNDSGYLLAALLDETGSLLEIRNVGDFNLNCEEIVKQTIAFSKSGAQVVLRYGEAASHDNTNANAQSITIDGLPLTMDCFDESDTTVISGVKPDTYLLTVLTENPDATVTLDGEQLNDGMTELRAGSYRRTLKVTITAPDGATARTYTIVLEPAPQEVPISVYYTLRFETNGGSSIDAIRKPSDTVIDLRDYKPTRTGYRFTGWYADAALTEAITELKLTGNKTVYAGWALGENPFADVSGNDWFYDDVLYVYENGLMNGIDAELFGPNLTTTRGMIVTILYRLEGEPVVSGQNPFTDVASGTYYEKAIHWAERNGIVTGYSSESFGPDDPITREQMATILYRYAKYRGMDVSVGEDTNILSYDDASVIAEYAVPAIQWACGVGLIQGTSQSTLSPGGNATRAQAAAILHRFRESLTQ